jgi:hypothetical protein
MIDLVFDVITWPEAFENVGLVACATVFACTIFNWGRK